MKITPVLIVEAIEKSLPFRVGRIGFEKTVEVADGDALGFVILMRDGAELMIQSVASVRKDVRGFAPKGNANETALFIEVADLDDILKRLEGYPVDMAERITDYGMREIGVRDPDRQTVLFASPRSN